MAIFVAQLDLVIFLICFVFRREVALRILTSKGRERGTYLLRDHTMKHESYVLSLIRDDDDFSHLVINVEEENPSNFVYKIDDKRKFQSLEELQDFYKDENNAVSLY